MKNVNKVIAQLEAKAEGFWLAINEVADYEFEWTVKPWLLKRGYTFSSGMEAWCVYDKDGQQVDKSKIPSRVLEVLQIAVPLYDHELGSIMPCFPED